MARAATAPRGSVPAGHRRRVRLATLAATAAGVAALAVLLLLSSAPGADAKRSRRHRKKKDVEAPKEPPELQEGAAALAEAGIPVRTLGADAVAAAEEGVGVAFNLDTARLQSTTSCVKGTPFATTFATGEVALWLTPSAAAMEAALSVSPSGSDGYGALHALTAGVAPALVTPASASASRASDDVLTVFGLAIASGHAARVKSPTLTKAAAAAAAKGPSAFQEACGHAYIAEVRRGAAAALRAAIRFTDARDRDAWMAKANYDAGSAPDGSDASVDVKALGSVAALIKKQNQSSIAGEVAVSVLAQQWGGRKGALRSAVNVPTEDPDDDGNFVSFECSTKQPFETRKQCAKHITKLMSYLRGAFAHHPAELGSDADATAVVLKPYPEAGADAGAPSGCKGSCDSGRSAVAAAYKHLGRMEELVEGVGTVCNARGFAARPLFDALADAVADDLEALQEGAAACVSADTRKCAHFAGLSDDDLRKGVVEALGSADAAVSTAALSSRKPEAVEAWLRSVLDDDASAVPFCAPPTADGGITLTCADTPFGYTEEPADTVHRMQRKDKFHNGKNKPLNVVIRNKHPAATLRPHNSTHLNTVQQVDEDGDPVKDKAELIGGKDTFWYEKGGHFHSPLDPRPKEYPVGVPCTGHSIQMAEEYIANGVHGCGAYDIDYSDTMRFFDDADGSEGASVRAASAEGGGLVMVMCPGHPYNGIPKAFGALYTREELIGALVGEEPLDTPADQSRNVTWMNVYMKVKGNPGPGNDGHHGSVQRLGHKLTWEMDTLYAPTGKPAALYTLELVAGEDTVYDVPEENGDDGEL